MPRAEKSGEYTCCEIDFKSKAEKQEHIEQDHPRCIDDPHFTPCDK